MPREDLEKLLGGFATNTLTEEERKALFEAALTDQALFNALADEQALKELLDDPRSRQQLLASLEAKTQAKMWFQQSWSWALAGSLAAAVLAVTLVTRETGVPPPVASKQQAASESAPAPQSGDAAPHAQAKRETKARRAPAPAKPSLKPADRVAATAPVPATRDETSTAADASSARKNALATVPAPTEGASAPPPAASQERQSLQSSVEQLQGEQHARALFYAGVAPPREPAASPSAEEAELGGLKEKTGEEAKRPDKMAKAAGKFRAALAPLGLRYSVANQRLTIETNDSAYLYVLGRNATGALTPLFPGKGAGAQAARVEKGKRYTVEAPSDVSQVIIALSRQPRADFQGAPASPPSTTTALLIEKAEEAAPSQDREKVVYVVDPRSDSSAGIIFETTMSNR